MDDIENKDLQLAFDFVKYTDRNIFLTGKAGTGKTAFLHDLKKSSPKRMIVLAPTGVAAINAGGVTLHSFFQLPFHPFIPSFYLPGNKSGDKGEQSDQSGYKMSREKINIIRSLDLLVIDEISMVRADTLDAVDSALRRYKNRSLPFGGVQMLMIGDLQQLAPVVKEDERELIEKYYDSSFFFGSKALKCTDYVTIELKHIYRQNDQGFINLLNKVRENSLDQEAMEELNKRYIEGFEAESGDGYITLTTHNYQSLALNDSKLEKLPGRPRTFKASIKDEFPELSYPNAGELILKEGAQVMFVKNDLSRNKLFFNGKIGKITAFDDDNIIVKCPGDDFPIVVGQTEWQNMKYTLNEDTKEIEEKVIGTFTQYPLRLAWAITIHKSQGLTFERAIIDAGDAFAHGQVYVALSRCRTLNGVVLSSKIKDRSIIGNHTVSDYISEATRNPPGQMQLEESKKAYQLILLRELFDFNTIHRNLNYCLKVVNENINIISGYTPQRLQEAITNIHTDLIEVSEKFLLQLNGILKRETDAETSGLLQDRVKKAGEYFHVKLEAALKDILPGVTVETDNKAVRKTVTEALKRAGKEGFTKLACLDAVRHGFIVSKYLEARAKAAIDLHELKTRTAKSVEDDSGITKHPELFRRLKAWRNEKAREMHLAHYMIIPQKTMVTLAGFLPQDLSVLKQVKGMGKKKSGKFGEELLEIITSYCREFNIEPDNGEGGVVVKESTKKIKADTKKISFDLYNEGKSPEEIAGERNLSLTTIESHLAYYVSTGEIPVNKLLSQEMVELISGHFEPGEELRMGPVKAALGEEVSWRDIRFVMSYIKFLRKSESEN